MRKLMIVVLAGVMMWSLPGQEAARDNNLSSVLGVQIGMTMSQTLTALQDRSRRFHAVPTISSNHNSLNLLTDLSVSDVRLGWHNGTEMVASEVLITFYHGKVIMLTVVRRHEDSGAIDHWADFLRKIPATTMDRSTIGGKARMVNAIESCAIGANGDDVSVMILKDADNWNSFLEEEKKLEDFFKSIRHEDEVLD